MDNYDTIYDYIRCSDVGTKIDRIKAIIDALEDQLLQAAGTSDIEEYILDTGQSRIRTTYRDPKKIEELINLLTRRLIKIENRCVIGRQMVLRDKKTFFINK